MQNLNTHIASGKLIYQRLLRLLIDTFLGRKMGNPGKADSIIFKDYTLIQNINTNIHKQ